MLNKSNIRDYQLNLIKEIKERNRVLLAVDMGLGKTISCLTAVEEMPEVKKILIVAPLRVAQTTWPDEFKSWEHLKDLTYTVIKGNEKQRLKCLEEDTRFYIINRENIPWLYQNCDIEFDMIIWDESSSLKAAKLKTAKGELTRFGALLNMVQGVPRLVLLTGTPTPNGLQDIFGQILILDNGERLGRSKNKFYQEYFIDRSRDPNYSIWEPKKSSYETVMQKCEDLIIKMKSDDYLKLPDFIPIDLKVELDKKERAQYDTLGNDFILKDSEDKPEIVATNVAVLIGKLLQLASGSVYKEDKSYITYHTKKLDALKDLAEENPQENILVFFNYQHEKAELKKMFGKDITFLEHSHHLSDWNNGKIKMLACHPASAGHGLNLQHGGSVMVWLSLPWSLELYQQANKRLHRSGQKNNVRCFHIITKDTVDEYVLKILKSKDARQEMIFDLIRNISK